MYYCELETAIGRLSVVEDDGAITHILFAHEAVPADAEKKDTPLLKKAAAQLREYFAGKRTRFDLPLQPRGTVFQKRVWDALQEIPYGETCCYGEIAAKTGNAKASRAVGAANGKNPIPIVIPCHRVIGSTGKLTGFAGGLENKEILLKLEEARA